MGSTTSGNLTDYPGGKPSGGGGAGGGASGEDRCNRAIACNLEEIEQCEFYSATASVPPENTALQIELRERLFAVDESGQTVGALPTRFNYLADCLATGFRYTGRVRTSSMGAVANVSADFAPHPP